MNREALPTLKLMLTAVLLAIPVLASGSSAIAAGVQAQLPCAYTGEVCKRYKYDGTDPLPVIRSFTFNMPRPGQAVAQFNGTMSCFVSGSNSGAVRIDSQIVLNSGAVPDYKKPGGARHALNFASGATSGAAATVNLAASRTMNFSSAGRKTVHFKFNRIQMDFATECWVYSAAFTVMTFP